MATHRVDISTDGLGNVVKISPAPLRVKGGDQVVLAYKPSAGATSSITVRMGESLFSEEPDGSKILNEIKIPGNGTTAVFISPRAGSGSFTYDINQQRSTTPDIIVDDD